MVHREDGHLGYLYMLANLEPPHFPIPIGVLRRTEAPCLDDLLLRQKDEVTEARGEGDLEGLIHAGDVWDVD